MVTVSASSYRVFSVDPPTSDTSSPAGKMVPTGVITDTHKRGGRAYGKHVNAINEALVYLAAKFAEEHTEYRLAPVTKRASEMADILTLISYAWSKLEGAALIPVKACSMGHMESLWKSFRDDLLHGRVRHPHVRMRNMVGRTQHVAEVEIRRKKLSFEAIRKAQQAKAQRIGCYEGWIVTHLELPSGDDFIPRLLDTGWYEHLPDAEGRFATLEQACLITPESLKAVTFG